MHGAGIINDAELAILMAGHQPIDSRIQSSPVYQPIQRPKAKRSVPKVYTAQELVSVYFSNQIPDDMTADETKAFEDLAKIYQPDRKKRLTYAYLIGRCIAADPDARKGALEVIDAIRAAIEPRIEPTENS